MSGFVFRKSEEMATSQSGGDAVEFEQERSFESVERHYHDAAEPGIRSLVSQTKRRPLSRLQKQAPAKVQLKRPSPDSMGLSCRSPIPLLSPILVSPLGGGNLERQLISEEAGKQIPEKEEESVVTAAIPTNGWQHLAAPFLAERICSFSRCFAELRNQTAAGQD